MFNNIHKHELNAEKQALIHTQIPLMYVWKNTARLSSLKTKNYLK